MDIKIPVTVELNDLWGAEPFRHEHWWPINFLVGANGTGKTRFADALKPLLSRGKLKPRFLGADRLAGLERGNAWQHSSRFHKGFDIGNFQWTRSVAAEEGRGADAFIILKQKLDVRIRLEALLVTFFKRRLHLAEEGGFLTPKLQRIHGGKEYGMREGESHGLKELLALLSFIYDDEFNCLIIDEPEINLHPQFQSFLMSEIRRLAGNPATHPGKKMFFLITHSPYFLDFRSIDELRSLLLFQPDQKPRVLGQLTTDDEYRLRRLLPRLNTHHKQFFFASRPIFVEGYRDQQLFTLIQEKRGRLLGVTGACFIDVNGKDEQDLFYRLCQQYNIRGQFISDLDALTSGKLRDSLSSNVEFAKRVSEEGLGSDLRDALKNFWTKLDAASSAPEASTDQAAAVLRGALAGAAKGDPKRYRFLVFLAHRRNDLKAVSNPPIPHLNYLAGALEKLRSVCAEAGLHLLPLGALENHCSSYTGLPWEITDSAKIACFSTETEFILQTTDVAAIEGRYAGLIHVLDAAQGLALLDLNQHLGYVIGDWIAKVQSAVARKEIVDAATLQTYAPTDWATHSRIFQLVAFDVAERAFICRLKLTPVVDDAEREFEFTEATDHANFALPKVSAPAATKS